MNKEEVYDTLINPLMAQIIDICKANHIQCLTSFSIPTEQDSDLMCTTFIDPDCEAPRQLRESYRLIVERNEPQLMAMTITSASPRGKR
jgi:hypothetical protein